MTNHKPDISKANICPPCPSDASMGDKIIYWLGIGLGSGLPKRAPGTWGTLGGLVVAIPLMMLGFVPFLIITIIASIVGIYICGRTSKLMKVHDDPHIVWDEWAGMWIALLPMVFYLDWYHGFSWLSLSDFFNVFLASNWQAFILYLLVFFTIFRLFDIVKPFPISWLDKRVSGGFGIMIDDVLAGVATIVVVYVISVVL